MPNQICLQCKKADKRKKFQFCSTKCTEAAAKNAPRLLRVPKDHVMYKDVKEKFIEYWESSDPTPEIAKIFLITWDKEMRSSFDNYRYSVAAMRGMTVEKAEVKRFRAEGRACRLGEPGCEKLCEQPEGVCRLCTAVRTGFVYSLLYKRGFVQRGIDGGVRFGGGLYMAPSSSKAYQYAQNMQNGSSCKAVLMARVVLGNPEQMWWEDHKKVAPSPGYDSVETCVPNEPTELVVYHEDAARPAYLILLH